MLRLPSFWCGDCLDFELCLSWVCLVFVCRSSGGCLLFVWCLFGVCLVFGSRLSGIYLVFAWCLLSGVCLGFVSCFSRVLSSISGHYVVLV